MWNDLIFSMRPANDLARFLICSFIRCVPWFAWCRWWLVWTFLNEITNDYITYCLPSEAPRFLVPSSFFASFVLVCLWRYWFAKVEWWSQVHSSYDQIVITWTKIVFRSYLTTLHPSLSNNLCVILLVMFCNLMSEFVVKDGEDWYSICLADNPAYLT